MRYVSRTHRVALDWLFDRVNLDPKILTRYIDTKHQLKDTLTKGTFKRDEWNSLLRFFSISHFSSLCCAQNFVFTSCPKTMAKRMQEQKVEDRIVATSKPTAMNLTSTVSTSSSSVNHPIVSRSTRHSKHLQGSLTSGQEEIQNPTQRRVLKEGLKDAYLGGWVVEVARKLAATDKSQDSWEFF